jgi:hypothetical protein
LRQPILVLLAGTDPSSQLAPEILTCEGYPWLEVQPAESFEKLPPGVELLIVVGNGVSGSAASKLAAAASGGVPLISLTPDPALAAAFGVSLGDPGHNVHLCVTDLPNWEHGNLPILCPDGLASSIVGGNPIASYLDPDGRTIGSAITRTGPKDNVLLYGYDLCKTIALLRHGNGDLDCPAENQDLWGGPRALYGFWELSRHIPHDVPLADVHQDILRSLVSQFSSAPRIWHFPDAAPSVWMVRGDGCGEEGADVEIETVEQFGAYLTFCRPFKSRYDGELMREWDSRGHGISIEANINHITQPTVDGTRQKITSEELNERKLPAIREHLEAHRDAFHDETGLEMEVFMTHSAQWTGFQMAEVVQELGWHTLHPFQSIDPRIRPGDEKGPYLIGTALPMRYFDHKAGVLDLWHVPYQWIDRIWQTVASNRTAETNELQGLIGETGDEYGEKLARFAHEAAARWHVSQVSSFHPCYVSKDWPLLGSSRRALEIGLKGAQDSGARFDNLESWSRFFRARAGIKLIHYDGKGTCTLESPQSIKGLTLLLHDSVHTVRTETGTILIRQLELEGRTQKAIVLDLVANQPTTISMISDSSS